VPAAQADVIINAPVIIRGPGSTPVEEEETVVIVSPLSFNRAGIQNSWHKRSGFWCSSFLHLRVTHRDRVIPYNKNHTKKT
ncbi:MAG: hypothetical protein AAFU71_04780, partial [Cyanobacteria bacterium J06632_22]